MEKSNSIINAVKRLERAGSEDSRATKKLGHAAAKVAELIEAQVPAGAELPRGYYIRSARSNVGSARFLCRDSMRDGILITSYIDGIGGCLHGDSYCYVPGQTRDAVLKFAEDVADGLLDEIAEWLEDRTAEADEAADALDDAKK